MDNPKLKNWILTDPKVRDYLQESDWNALYDVCYWQFSLGTTGALTSLLLEAGVNPFDSLTSCGNTCVPSGIFYRGKGLSKIAIPDGIKIIEDDAFKFSRGLKKVVLPQTLKEIGSCAFYECLDLEDINLPESLTEVLEKAFAYTRLSKVIWPGTVNTIPIGCFKMCSELKEVMIGPGALQVGNEAFLDCNKLERVVLPSSIRIFGHQCFPEHLRELWFNGDRDQWRVLRSNRSWDHSMTVHCKDGDLEIWAE